jgi:hypothetical protein
VGIDFLPIRVRLLKWRLALKSRLQRLYWQAIDAKIDLLKRSVEALDDKTLATELAATLQESDSKLTQQHRQALYTAVGQGLSHWAAMEETLIAITSLLLRTHEAMKVGIIMYWIVNFNTWLSIIDELFSQEPLYTPLKPKWNKINENLKRLNDTRNRLAHHSIYHGERAATFAGDILLRPSRFDARKKTQKYQPLDVDQILKFADSVADVQEDLTALLNAMTALLTHETSSQRKSFEQRNGQNPP